MTDASGGTGPGAGPGWRWDVALSFDGAQRDYVEEVARALKARGVRCFYDADEQIELWGKYLAEELPAIYAEQAAAVVVFVSAEYAARDWTRLERRVALNRAVRERREYVLPARFDDTPLPGLLSDMVTVDLRGRAPQHFAAMIAGKLAALAITAPAPPADAGGLAQDVESARPAGAVRASEADPRRPRRRRSSETLDLTLAVVGFEASGKTVFIGSMFNELRVPDASGVFLDTTPENAGKLLALYNTTADTAKEFPNSTNKGELIEWPFTVKVKSAASVTDIGNFSYLDFAGESLRDLYTAAPNPETQRLYARFKGADILMATLDGLQVKRYMENRPLPWFRDDLGTLLTLLSNHHKAVNLILTKWDILEDQYTFRMVVERLLQISQFANFVMSQRILGVCRLIPVSSVGPGFVREDGNAMRKIPGKVINPVRVEAPIACALSDALTAQQRKRDSTGPSRLLNWAKAMELNLESDFPESELGRFTHQQGM